MVARANVTIVPYCIRRCGQGFGRVGDIFQIENRKFKKDCKKL